MIKGYCYTNNDELKKYKWPMRFVAVPNKDDALLSMDGGMKAYVAGIEHAVTPSKVDIETTYKPWVQIELISVKDFHTKGGINGQKWEKRKKRNKRR